MSRDRQAKVNVVFFIDRINVGLDKRLVMTGNYTPWLLTKQRNDSSLKLQRKKHTLNTKTLQLKRFELVHHFTRPTSAHPHRSCRPLIYNYLNSSLEKIHITNLILILIHYPDYQHCHVSITSTYIIVPYQWRWNSNKHALMWIEM